MTEEKKENLYVRANINGLKLNKEAMVKNKFI
jgi:hypothetical protein